MTTTSKRRPWAVLGLENLAITPGEGEVKVAVRRQDSYAFRRNSLGELLEGKPHEQFLWGGLETGEEVQHRASPLPDSCFEALKQSLELKTFVGTSENAVQTQIWTAPIAMLLMKYLQLGSTFWVELVSKWCTAATQTRAHRFA